MVFDPNIHHRRSIRLRGYDYASNGAYFVTICCNRKRPIFGRIENGAMRCNLYGQIAREEWLQTEVVRPDVVVDEFVIMPNHVHGIVFIVGAHGCAPNADVGTPPTEGAQLCAPTGRAPRSLGSLIAMYKATVTRRINAIRAEKGLPVPVNVWQRNYYERIIREEDELNATRRYIIENPQNWPHDENHP